tara:strand:- start:188 stop:403 length:216 start_codon:yes stop_codon:yes gene_type:complete
MLRLRKITYRSQPDRRHIFVAFLQRKQEFDYQFLTIGVFKELKEGVVPEIPVMSGPRHHISSKVSEFSDGY